MNGFRERYKTTNNERLQRRYLKMNNNITKRPVEIRDVLVYDRKQALVYMEEDLMDYKKIWIKIKKNKELILFVIVGIPFIVYLLSVPAVFPSGGNDWSNFWGNYLGGLTGAAVTIIVFGCTIEENKKEQKREHRLEIIPVLCYEIENIRKEEGIKTCERLFCDGFTGDGLGFDIYIKNIGLGAAQEVTLNDWIFEKEKGTKQFISSHQVGLIPVEKEKALPILLDFPDKSKYDPEVGQEEIFWGKVTFKNIFGDLYEQNIKFRFYYLNHSEGTILTIDIVDLTQADLVEDMKKTK